MTARAALLCSALAFLTPAALRAGEKTVGFRTADGCLLEAFYLPPPRGGALVFVNTHGLGSDRNEWRAFDTALEKAGFGYLSLDLRGHGGSLKCGGRKADYRGFGPGDWRLLSRDITAAAAFLKSKKVPANRLVLCGASIGANLSAKAAAEGPAPAGLILLSPGRDYAGVQLGDELFMGRKARLFIAASPDDPYAWQSSLSLASALSREKEPRYTFKAGPSGHGVNMFTAPGSGLVREITDWARNLQKQP